MIPYAGRDDRAWALIRRTIAALGLVAVLAVPGLASADPAAPLPPQITDEQLSHFEVATLGPAHAAEHARRRQLQREVAGASTVSGTAPTMLAAATSSSALVAGDPRDVGMWTAPAQLPVVAIHAVLLPTRKILLFSFEPGSNGTRGLAAVWDPATGASTRVDPPSNVWCSGHTVLPDGRVVVVGGNLENPATPAGNNKGLNQIWVFNPFTETWIRQPDMAKGRWYPTATTLPSGKVLITSGWDETGTRTRNTDIEVFTPSSDPAGVGTVSLLASRQFGLYPHQFVLPDGRVGVVGPGAADTGILDPATGAWTDLPNLAAQRTGASAVLAPSGPFGSGRILLFGGGTTDGTDKVDAIDAMSSAAAWESLAPLPEIRRNLNTVTLPDGTLLTVGGNTTGSYDGPLLESLLYDPKSNIWTHLASQTDPRGYHSTALLLPDGRVWSAGDDGPLDGGNATDTYEIFSPPYLFRGPRPTITSAPATVALGSAFTVGTPDDVVTAALVALGSTTHANDMNQRLITLTPVRRGDGTGVDLTAPASANVAVPGQYMLFLLDATGVPSVARILTIVDPTLPSPPPPPSPPPAPAPAPPVSPAGTARACAGLTARFFTDRCPTFRRGTRRADVLVGTAAPDRLLGLGGGDLVTGRAGDDSLEGGVGNDRLLGGGGDDWLIGGPGGDRLDGGAGRDVYLAGAGADVIRSRDGVREVVNCGAGRDVVTADRIDVVIGCERVSRR